MDSSWGETQITDRLPETRVDGDRSEADDKSSRKVSEEVIPDTMDM